MPKSLLPGIATMLLVPYGVALIAALTGFAIDGISVALIVPVGAAACSYAAIYGFIYAAKAEECERPALPLLAAMVAASLIAQLLIYVFGYVGAFVPGQFAAGLMSFADYIEFSIEGSSIVMRRGGGATEAGELGYLGAITQLIAFLVIPFAAYRMLPSSGSFREDRF